jgi:hypothetical protein
MTLYNEDKTMVFDFSGFKAAEDYDTSGGQCAGLKTVDFVANDGEIQYFIEVKNYFRHDNRSRSGGTLWIQRGGTATVRGFKIYNGMM